MRVHYFDAAAELGVPPLQVLVELAAMNQPWEECWPECDEGFVATVRERRRVRMGFTPESGKPQPATSPRQEDKLPVSDLAAAVLDKLLRKSYGLKSVRVFTLVQKWVHGSTEAHIRELVQRGNLEWTDAARSLAVNLVASRLSDTEYIVEIYRRRQARADR